MNQQSHIFNILKQTLDSYSPLSNDTWGKFKALCKIKHVDKSTLLYQSGKIPDSFAFVYSGMFRLFITDDKGNECIAHANAFSVCNSISRTVLRRIGGFLCL